MAAEGAHNSNGLPNVNKAPLPPRDEDPLFIDAMRRHPVTIEGESAAAGIQAVVGAAGSLAMPTEQLLSIVDRMREQDLREMDAIMGDPAPELTEEPNETEQ